MKLLMHICGANCSLYPLKTLFSKGIDIKGIWLNPNIHPYVEYRMRLESLQKLQKLWDLDIEYIDHYGVKEFVRSVAYREDDRCILCYSMRLEDVAKTAKKMGLDGFTTSLLVSPFQKFDMIIHIGKEMGKRYSLYRQVSDNFRHRNLRYWRDTPSFRQDSMARQTSGRYHSPEKKFYSLLSISYKHPAERNIDLYSMVYRQEIKWAKGKELRAKSER